MVMGEFAICFIWWVEREVADFGLWDDNRTYIIFACFCFSMFFFVWFFIPETKGRLSIILTCFCTADRLL